MKATLEDSFQAQLSEAHADHEAALEVRARMAPDGPPTKRFPPCSDWNNTLRRRKPLFAPACDPLLRKVNHGHTR